MEVQYDMYRMSFGPGEGFEEVRPGSRRVRGHRGRVIGVHRSQGHRPITNRDSAIKFSDLVELGICHILLTGRG